MELNSTSQPTKYIKKLTLEKCFNCNNKLTLYFYTKDYNSYTFLDIVIRNTKNRDEFICPFTINSPNSITIDLNNICQCLTDYEGSLSIVAKSSHTLFSITPILSKEKLIIDGFSHKSPYKLYIRTLENGELRLSSIINKKL